MPKQPILNLNFLNKENIIEGVTQDGKPFYLIVRRLRKVDNGAIELEMIEVNKHFTKWNLTVPTACDSDGFFTSTKDPDYSLKLFQTDASVKLVSVELEKFIKNPEHT